VLRDSWTDGAEIVGDACPGVKCGIGPRQVEHDSSAGDNDSRAELEQAVPQRADLKSGAVGAAGGEPDLLHENVRRGGEQDSKLVRPES
jgi:hypothetical protein